MKIIDCFTFYNELELLNYRLNILNNIIDYFILVEANQTHTGNKKGLFFDENKNLYEKFKNKIIHIIIDLPLNSENINIKKDEQWINEKYQRNCIKKGLSLINLDQNDLIIISDVDEIPDPKTLYHIKNENLNINLLSFEQDMYYYNLNSKIEDKWHRSKIISYKTYNELNTTCDNIRLMNTYNVIHNGGWHLSYFGNASFIKNKIENFGHQEYNSNTFTCINNIKKNIDNFNDVFNRDSCKINKIEIIDNKYLPTDYNIYLKSFYKIYIENNNLENSENIITSDDINIFRYLCYKGIDIINKANINEIKLNCKNEAVLIEFRNLHHIEFIIRNTIIKLGKDFSHTIVCGNLNYNIINNICKEISPNIKIIKKNIDNINQIEYNNMLLTIDFWNIFSSDKILIYQEDTIIFKNNINYYIEYDYIGAPWNMTSFENNINNIHPAVGNGGFSLRNRKLMIEILSKKNDYYNFFINDINLNYHCNIKLDNIPEDYFFSKILLVLNKYNIPSGKIASEFSTENICNNESLGGHKFWNSDKNWINRMEKLINEYK